MFGRQHDYMQTHTPTHIHTPISLKIHLCMGVIHSYLHLLNTRRNLCMYECIHVYVCTHTDQLPKYTLIQVYTHLLDYFTRLQTHTHTCISNKKHTRISAYKTRGEEKQERPRKIFTDISNETTTDS